MCKTTDKDMIYQIFHSCALITNPLHVSERGIRRVIAICNTLNLYTKAGNVTQKPILSTLNQVADEIMHFVCFLYFQADLFEQCVFYFPFYSSEQRILSPPLLEWDLQQTEMNFQASIMQELYNLYMPDKFQP